MKLLDFVKRADDVINLANEALASVQPSPFGGFASDVEKFTTFRSAGLSFLVSIYGNERTQYNEFDKATRDNRDVDVRAGRGVMIAVKSELTGGWLVSVREVVSAEVFADYMSMAEHLLDKNFHDAAAVIIGSTLEGHLRQLATRHGIPPDATDSNGNNRPKKADLINAELTKAGTYNALVQKNVTAWLDLRNKAAHGQYTEYTKDHVDLMFRGVSNFLAHVS
jgi:hypothetical protein